MIRGFVNEAPTQLFYRVSGSYVSEIAKLVPGLHFRYSHREADHQVGRPVYFTDEYHSRGFGTLTFERSIKIM